MCVAHEPSAYPPAVVVLLSGLGGTIVLVVLLGKVSTTHFQQQAQAVDDVGGQLTRRTRSRVLNPVMALASASGEPFTLYPLTAIVALHWLTEQRRTAIATLSMALLGSALVNKVVKAMVERPRPRLRLHRQNSSGSSFPSQHLSMSVATYGTLAYLIQQQRPPPAHRSVGRLWAAVVGLCGLMSWSRVYHGVHHPTDILGGWITGSLWYGTCRLVYASLEAQGATNRAPGSHAGGAPAARQETVPSDGITGDRPGAQPDSTKQG